jgi:hypothetical protein
MDEETNINIEGEGAEQSETETAESEEQVEETEELTKESDKSKESEEDQDDEVEYKEKTRKRFEKLNDDLSETKQENKQLAQKVELLTKTIEKLSSKEITPEERDEGKEILEKIKKLDEEGFTSYTEMAELVAKYTQSELKKAQKSEKQERQEQYAKSVQQMQTDLKELTDLGLLKKEEMKDFVNWCSDKLDETKSAEFPEGNVKIYADFHRAISHYRRDQEASKEPDTKKRLDRSATPPSSSGKGTPNIKVDLADLQGMTLKDAMKRSREAVKN